MLKLQNSDYFMQKTHLKNGPLGGPLPS